jgi:hypothetical protein
LVLFSSFAPLVEVLALLVYWYSHLLFPEVGVKNLSGKSRSRPGLGKDRLEEKALQTRISRLRDRQEQISFGDF